MIESIRLKGESATAIYLDGDWVPVDKEKAQIVKVQYADGRIGFFAAPSTEASKQPEKK